uniref:Uncharacterized protein n=1 Tax=Psilocybe cubensis TaxID=181762 RepID=A0A8H7XUW5_PSICU
MSLYVKLETPGAFDFAAFTRATRGTLALLASLLKFQKCDPTVLGQIEAQVSGFVKAIRLGTSAAQCGFTTAEDILILSELVQSTTLEERREYLNGTLELADQAYSQSKEAQQVFRQVRTEIMSIVGKLNSVETVSKPSSSATRTSLEGRLRGIEALDSFEKHISALADWWDWIKIETKVQRNGRSAIVDFDDSSLRERSVIDRWKLLRVQFLDYTNMVSVIPRFIDEICL